MTSNIPEDEFSLSGWPVFNGLYFTEVYDSDFEPQDMMRSFKQYEEGTPSDAKEGYLDTGLVDKINQMGNINLCNSRIIDNLYTYEYMYEKWPSTTIVDANGNTIAGHEKNHKNVEVYWEHDDYLFLRGPKKLIEKKQEDIQSTLSGKVKAASINFEFDFFLWILYQYRKKGHLTSELSVRSLSECKTIGEDSNMGDEITASSENIDRSVAVIAPILSGNSIDEIEGHFILGSHYIVAKIASEGRIHIKASEEDLKDISDLRRITLSIQFLSEFLSLYEQWLKLDTTEKYPPRDFFEELYDICVEEDFRPLVPPEDLFKEYERKREGIIPDPVNEYALNKFQV